MGHQVEQRYDASTGMLLNLVTVVVGSQIAFVIFPEIQYQCLVAVFIASLFSSIIVLFVT